jgi:hypothetical protein
VLPINKDYTSMTYGDVIADSPCFSIEGAAMSKRSFSVVSALFALLLSLSEGTLNARDADLASLTLAAAQTTKSNAYIPVARDIGTA